jgi:putative transposase
LIPYLFVDASYFNVRTDGRFINKALLIATAIREDGYREILSATVANSEDESCWESCFEASKSRGLNGAKLVISDDQGRTQMINRSWKWRFASLWALRCFMWVN